VVGGGGRCRPTVAGGGGVGKCSANFNWPDKGGAPMKFAKRGTEKQKADPNPNSAREGKGKKAKKERELQLEYREKTPPLYHRPPFGKNIRLSTDGRCT